MAETFNHVHGIDVSPGMLEKAKVAVAGLPVTLHCGDGLTLPVGDATADAVFSTFVFQHFESRDDALANWREIARILKPGGSLMIQLPIHVWPSGLERLESVYATRQAVQGVRVKRARKRMSHGGEPPMRGTGYEWNALETDLVSLGLGDIEMVLFRAASNGGQNHCVLARKPLDTQDS